LDDAPAATALARHFGRSHADGMFVVDEATAAAIRAALQQGGELSAVVELRRHFPLISNDARARRCVRTIAGWKPLPPVKPKRGGEQSRAMTDRVTGAPDRRARGWFRSAATLRCPPLP
jgi:hypothetical protein